MNFTENDITDIYGLKYSLTVPGAMYADKILIKSGAMKELFCKSSDRICRKGYESSLEWKK